MADKHLCVAIYMTHDQADEAFSRLQAEGADMDLLSFVGRDYWKNMVGSRNAGGRFLYRGNAETRFHALHRHGNCFFNPISTTNLRPCVLRGHCVKQVALQ